MNGPQRWVGDGKQLEGRLLRATLEERVPEGSLNRAAQRLGLSAAILSSATTAFANATVAETLVTGTVVTAKASLSSTSLFVLVKGVTIGLAVGAVAVGSAQLVLSPAASSASVAPTSHSKEAVPRVPVNVSKRAAITPTGILEVTPPLPATQEPNVSVVRETTTVTNVPIGPVGHRTPKTQPSSLGVVTEVNSTPIDAASVLKREVRILDQSRTALKSNDARRALAVLDHAERTEPLRALTKEAKLIRVEALGTLGRTTEAKNLAAELIRQGVSTPQRAALSRWVEP